MCVREYVNMNVYRRDHFKPRPEVCLLTIAVSTFLPCHSFVIQLFFLCDVDPDADGGRGGEVD
jgi:hypothetical protein